MPSLMEVTDQTFTTEVINSSKPVVVEFWMEPCHACERALPWLEECAITHGDQVKIVKARIEDNSDAVTRLGIRGAPFFFIFRNGEIVARQPGCPDRSRLLAWIERAVGEAPEHAHDLEWIREVV